MESHFEGGRLNFTPLAQAYQSADAKVRAQSIIELRNLSGSPLGWSRSGQETVLTVHGNGALEFFRRGDFGERGSKPPGLWRGACEAPEVEAIWRAFQGLGPESFPGRAADPGETVTQLQAQCAGKVGMLTWGPGELGVARPGMDALLPLRQLLAKAQKEVVWNLGLSQGAPVRSPEGLEMPLEFFNDGSDPVRFLLSPPGMGVDLSFRYAVDEDDGSGQPPLSINWIPVDVLLPKEPSLRMATLRSGDSLRVAVALPVDLSPGGRYLGHFSYSQIGLGEYVAGTPVFAGLAFTDIFKFTAPA